MSYDMSDQSLMDYFNFDESDLVANRTGNFSEKQKARLVQLHRADSKLSAIIAAISLVVGMLGFLIPLFTQGFGRAAWWLIWLLPWGALGVWGLLPQFEQFNVVLKKVQGPINIVEIKKKRLKGDRTRTPYFVYELHIGEVSFDVSAALQYIVAQGDVYAVYYAEGSESGILSAELISITE